MLTFIREITCRVACLCYVLVSDRVDDRLWVRFVSFRWDSVIPPGSRLLVFPSLDKVVPQELDYFTAFQSFLIGSLSCYFVALAVNIDHFGSLFGPGKALDTTMPEATMELKDGFGFWMVAIKFSTDNEPFTPVTTSVMVNVSATLPGHML